MSISSVQFLEDKVIFHYYCSSPDFLLADEGDIELKAEENEEIE